MLNGGIVAGAYRFPELVLAVVAGRSDQKACAEDVRTSLHRRLPWFGLNSQQLLRGNQIGC